MSKRCWTALFAAGALAGFAGCGGAATQPVASAGESEPAPPSADVSRLRQDLQATVLENYGLVELGNLEAFADRVAADRPIVLFGVRPDDLSAGIGPESLVEDTRLFADRRTRMLSRNLDLHVSGDRSVGWVFDEMSYRVPYRGREASIPLRVTALYTRDVDRWVIAMQHSSYPVPIPDLVGAARSGELPEPERFQTGYEVDGPAPELRRIAWRIVSGAVGPHYRERHMADSPDALVLLPGPRQEHRGSDAMQAPTLGELFASPAGEEAEVEIGDHRIEVARSGGSAWMAANLAVIAPDVDDAGDSVKVPLRGTFVFEDRPGRGWVLVQAHISAAQRQERIAERVFGTPTLD